MKRSEELLELAVISIEDGKEVGRVSDLVVNPAKGCVEFLIIDNGSRYMGMKILPFKMVEGVGEYAVTVQSLTSITDLNEQPDVNGLLEKNVQVKGTKVLSKKGRLIGAVNEYMIDDDSEGKISGCEVTAVNSGSQSGFIASDQIITFGKDVLVVSEDAEPVPPGNPTETSRQSAKSANSFTGSDTQQLSGQGDDKQDDSDKQEPSQAAKLFEERQRQYLLGRKVSKRIETDNGEVLAEEGEVITEELLDKTKEAGKFMELSMNTKA